jgi:hypothetical protein
MKKKLKKQWQLLKEIGTQELQSKRYHVKVKPLKPPYNRRKAKEIYNEEI